jgi:Pectinacetylesterase
VRLGTNTGWLVALPLVPAALATTVTACGNDDKAGATTASDTTIAAADQKWKKRWKKVAPGGDCQCSDGSEFNFWVRKANPKKVVFYLQGGGACFSAKTCAPDSDLYRTRVGEGPAGEGGMFDFADERNPFADHSVVYVPYCSADVHIGDTTTKYAPGLTVHHKGYVNGTAALDHLAATFPRATDVVVIGESAGSVAAPLYAGLVSDRLSGARITALADGSGCSSSRAPGTTRRSSSPATTTPTTRSRRAGTGVPASRRRTCCRGSTATRPRSSAPASTC